MRQAQNTDTHALNQSLLINTFGIHLEPGCKSHGQIIHYRIAKNVQKQETILLYFQTNDPDRISCSLATVLYTTNRLNVTKDSG